MKRTLAIGYVATIVFAAGLACAADAPSSSRSRERIGTTARQAWWKPYRPPCVERENIFEFTEKPAVKYLGNDKYEITFAVKGACDVTVGIVDEQGVVVRHIGSGVLGKNAPAPFQGNSLKQTLYWNGKDDLHFYVKEPNKLKLRVMLGLKPEFDKLLGPTSPKALPGRVWGVAVDADGAYVFARGRHRAHITCRRFDHDANYVATIFPPPANLPEEKLGGMGFVEYEPGKRSLHGPIINWSVWHEGFWMPPGMDGGSGVLQCRPAAANGRIYMLSCGWNSKDSPENMSEKRIHRPKLYHINTDGSTTSEGINGRVWFETRGNSSFPHLAVSPDGSRAYGVHLEAGRGGNLPLPTLIGGPTGGAERAQTLVGEAGNPGSDETHLNGPMDVACDSQGRVYVTDQLNNRVQIYTPEGKFLKTLKVQRPALVQAHLKTGDIYVSHLPSVAGKSVSRITVFSAFPELSEKRSWDGIRAAVMTLDSWTKDPRLWIGDEGYTRATTQGFASETIMTEKGTLRVYEDDGKDLRVISDFEEEARRDAGNNYHEPWAGGYGDKVVCDPVREHVYTANREPPDWRFDLRSGKLLGSVPSIKGVRGGGGGACDFAFDKRGYMHIHTDYHGGKGKIVLRVDPGRFGKGEFVEVPYNYGEQWGLWKGALMMPSTDTQAWSWGMGVNMMGEVAVINDIGYSPKYQDDADKSGSLSKAGRMEIAVGMGRTFNPYTEWKRRLKDREKRGEELFHAPFRPGVPLHGATTWTWDANGEVKTRGGVVIGRRVTGVQIDEDGFVYFTNARRMMKGGKPFLFERGGNYGGGPYERFNRTPFFGVYMKTKQTGVEFHLRNPPIPRDWEPKRPPDLAHPLEGGFAAYGGEKTWVWVEKAEWIYAGASPIVGEHCDCPQMRPSVDWFKRSFVPECYRHSVGALDANGNLICHIGQYGNFDSGRGSDSRVPLGGDGVASTRIAFVSATDNYLCMDDWGQRFIVVKLGYHAEETAPIRTN